MSSSVYQSSHQKLVPLVHLSPCSSNSSSSTSISSNNSSSSSPSSNHFTPPNFTIKELLGVIPPHCFERSALRSFSYLIWDLLLSSFLLYIATYIDPLLNSNGSFISGPLGKSLNLLAWALYAYAIGLVWTGIWVLAHECGHQSFSTSKTLNNSVGWLLHSALLVPYHSWRITHAQHHAATGHMSRDQVFVPKTRSQRGLKPLSHPPTQPEPHGSPDSHLYQKMDDLLEDAPIWVLTNLIIQQLLGWPAYILKNASGQRHYPSWTNHFNPQSIMFDKRHRSQVLLSDLGIGIMLSLLTYWGSRTSFGTVFKYYIVPYLWVNNWLVLITFLQHTDPLLPHYRDGAFTFQRGALCTIDRNIHGFFFHGIAETHVAHHLCSKIPHYHAWDATRALKQKLGTHYHKSEENFWRSLWNSYRLCRFVEDDGDIVFYKNARGEAARRVLSVDEKSSDSGVDVSGEKL